jgi:outer membrane protein assembly factor BamD (BamD/ComL family)
VAAVAAAVAVAQNRPVGTWQHGYATDQFEGFEAFGLDDRIEQKTRSLWYGVRADTPAGQLAYARAELEKGHLRGARKGFEALVSEWPEAPEAAEAQLGLARLYEQRKKYARAFDEYQYLLTFYAGVIPYDEVLDRQFKIANFLLHDNVSMFGWVLSGSAADRKRFEQIVRNAPSSPLAPQAMLIVGGIRTSEKETDDAIRVYDGLLNRYGESAQATDAAYLSAKCRYDRASKHTYNEAHCRDAIAFLRAITTRMPRHPQIGEMTGWLSELSAQLEEQCYKNAVFYDTRQRNRNAALMAYNSFLKEFRESKYADRVRARVTELEAKQKPAKQ